MSAATAVRSVRGQAIADLTSEPWGDEEAEDWTPREMPAREDLRRYKTPVQYWEPEEPGKSLMPYSSLGHYPSLEEGRWVCESKWQEDAVRDRLSRLGNPDDFKVTPEQLAVVRGKGAPGGPTNQYCHTPLCHFVTCSPLAAQLHETLRGHTLKFEPRKGR